MCPPGVDQTCRTEQKWQLVAPKIQQSMSLTDDGDVWGSDILQNIFDPKNRFGAMQKLARPVQPSSVISSSSPSTNEPIFRNLTTRSAIETLPIEMVLTVLESGDLSKTDILALALASPLLLPIIITFIQSNNLKAAAPWAGTPIACLGNYTLNLPTSFMSDEVLAGKFAAWEAITPAPAMLGGGRGLARPRWGLPPSRQFFWDCSSFAKPVSPAIEAAAWQAALESLDTTDCESVKALELSLACPDFYPKNTEWILRNHSKKEYYIPQPFPKTVRKKWTKPYSRYTEARSTVTVPQILGFDDVLLLKTCWTNVPPHDSGLKKAAFMGSWAGDCFDIVARGVFEKEREGWKDVGAKVVEEVRVSWDGLNEGDEEDEWDESEEEE